MAVRRECTKIGHAVVVTRNPFSLVVATNSRKRAVT